jgi:hypothetical protein
MSRWRIGAWVLGAAIGLCGVLSMHSRGTKAVNAMEQVVADAEALLKIFQNIRDPASAQAAINDVASGHRKFTSSLQGAIESAEFADSKGGVTDAAKNKFEQAVATLTGIAEKQQAEIERLTRISGLPKNFWMTLREAQFTRDLEISKFIPNWEDEEAKRFTREASALFEKITPGRAVLVEFLGTRADDPQRLKNTIREKLPAEGEVVFIGAHGTYSFFAGPVDDFDAFRKAMDFVQVADFDAAQMTLHVRPKAASEVEIAGTIQPAPANPTFGENLSRRGPRGRRGIRGASAEMAEILNATAETNTGSRSVTSAMPRQTSLLPTPTDSQYYRKLSELMTSGSDTMARQQAIQVLIGTKPADITDVEVRKQIARNFRDLASEARRSSDVDLAIRGLVIYGGKFSAPILIDLISKNNLRIEPIMLDALSATQDPKAAEVIVKMLGNFFNHDAAALAIAKMGSIAEQPLMDAAPSSDAKVSVTAIALLGDVGTEKSLSLLRQAQRSSNPQVKLAAENSTRKIGERRRSGQPIAADTPVDFFAAFSRPIPSYLRSDDIPSSVTTETKAVDPIQ